jgi:hypothetical protein
MRNTGTPLHIWISQHKSINNLHDNAHLFSRPTGAQIVREVLMRFVKLYDVDVTDMESIVGKLVTRYSSRWTSIDEDIKRLTNPKRFKGIVRIEHDPEYPNITRFVANPTLEELHYLERIKQMDEEQERKKESYQAWLDGENQVNKVIKVDKIKKVNRLTKGWEKHYFNLQKKPAKLPKALEEIEELVEVPAMHPPGVYFLCQENQVVYVGQSMNPSARIAQHQADKQFNRVFMIPTNNLDAVETMYIKKFKPKYNKAQNY